MNQPGKGLAVWAWLTAIDPQVRTAPMVAGLVKSLNIWAYASTKSSTFIDKRVIQLVAAISVPSLTL
jgi:hypothetical protein